jgi:hypothetical protein
MENTHTRTVAMVCVEQSDALVRAYQDEDEEDLPALEEVAGQKCALVIAPTVRGFSVCAVTQDGEEAYCLEVNAPQWQPSSPLQGQAKIIEMEQGEEIGPWRGCGWRLASGGPGLY